MNKIAFLVLIVTLALCSCVQSNIDPVIKPQDEKQFAAYWYQGKAELNVFKLRQARYGEIRDGHAIMIFVTEPFSLKNKTKANVATDEDPVVMKLNFTRTFLTGIYPYSVMTSVFYPVNSGEHAVKVSTSIQEWCGHVYMELNKKSKYDVKINSYFEGESGNKKLDIVALEDEILTQIRIDPSSLPLGEMSMIPSFTFIRLKHVELKPYPCTTKLIENGKLNTYVINCTELERTVEISYESEFPYSIVAWKEIYRSGFGEDAPVLTTEGTLDQSLMIDYWTKNTLKDSTYRRNLHLE